MIISVISTTFATTYEESIGTSGLNYISLALGFFVGAPCAGKTADKLYARLKARNPRGQGRPEHRLPLSLLWSLLAPSGLILFGWSAHNRLHWIGPNIGLFFFAFGTIATFQRAITYLVDSYTGFTASAVAVITFWRSLAGFALPLAAPSMYHGIGYGWGNSVLALALGCVAILVPIILWIFGEKMRKSSSYTFKGTRQTGAVLGGQGGPKGSEGPGTASQATEQPPGYGK